jgi:hypothetical protein
MEGSSMSQHKTDIERLARAAHRAELAINNEKNEAVIEIDWEMHGWRYIEGQRAALKALSKPSAQMLDAARMTIMATRGEPKDVISSAVFTTMIQSILEEAGE